MSVFFFKQKTAYEMRISDWSSDVCSSDLLVTFGNIASGLHHFSFLSTEGHFLYIVSLTFHLQLYIFYVTPCCLPWTRVYTKYISETCPPGYGRYSRSEEHTSELQSLMRISYAVFCLKKKK